MHGLTKSAELRRKHTVLPFFCSFMEIGLLMMIFERRVHGMSPILEPECILY